MVDSPRIMRLRLAAQLIEPGLDSSGAPDPAAVVAHLGAMQAQDYAGALWAIGLRSATGTTFADVERAIEQRRIVRTWPMRGTLHFVAPGDVRWMLALLARRVAPAWNRRHDQLGLSPADFDRATALFRDALSGGRALTRAQMLGLLDGAGLSTDGQRGYHLLGWLSQQGVLCLGPMSGSEQTFVLLDEWVPAELDALGGFWVDREQGLARLAERYFIGHGPATVDDLARWAGVTKADARAGMASVGDRLERFDSGGKEYWCAENCASTATPPARSSSHAVHLLPGFDEFYIGYADKSVMLGEFHETYSSQVGANGLLRPTVVIGGMVVGTWRRAVKRDRVDVTVTPFRPLTAAERRRVTDAAERYAGFLGRTAGVTLAEPA